MIDRISSAVFVVAMALSSMAMADAGTHRAAAEGYLAVTNVPARLETLMDQVREKQLTAVGKWYVPTDTRGPAIVYVEKASELVADELSWPRLKDEFIDAYVSVYSEQELRGLIKFYQSPLGQKYLSKRTQLVSSGLQITERHLQILLPKLESLSREYSRALEKAKTINADQ